MVFKQAKRVAVTKTMHCCTKVSYESYNRMLENGFESAELTAMVLHIYLCVYVCEFIMIFCYNSHEIVFINYCCSTYRA